MFSYTHILGSEMGQMPSLHTLSTELTLQPFLTFADINECSTGQALCHNYSTCTDTEGSYECTCDIGFSGDGLHCTSQSL